MCNGDFPRKSFHNITSQLRRQKTVATGSSEAFVSEITALRISASDDKNSDKNVDHWEVPPFWARPSNSVNSRRELISGRLDFDSPPDADILRALQQQAFSSKQFQPQSLSSIPPAVFTPFSPLFSIAHDSSADDRQLTNRLKEFDYAYNPLLKADNPPLEPYHLSLEAEETLQNGPPKSRRKDEGDENGLDIGQPQTSAGGCDIDRPTVEAGNGTSILKSLLSSGDYGANRQPRGLGDHNIHSLFSHRPPQLPLRQKPRKLPTKFGLEYHQRRRLKWPSVGHLDVVLTSREFGVRIFYSFYFGEFHLTR